MAYRPMIKFRISYTIIALFTLLAVGVPAPTALLTVAAIELIMAVYVFYQTTKTQLISTKSFTGYLLIQYVGGKHVDPVEIIHIAGARILAAMVGVFGGWFYIPACIIGLASCIDTVKKKRRPK
jgi:hypothetical protein